MVMRVNPWLTDFYTDLKRFFLEFEPNINPILKKGKIAPSNRLQHRFGRMVIRREGWFYLSVIESRLTQVSRMLAAMHKAWKYMIHRINEIYKIIKINIPPKLFAK